MTYTRVDGCLVSIDDAAALEFDKMTFGVAYLKATDARLVGEVVYCRVPPSEVSASGSERAR